MLDGKVTGKLGGYFLACLGALKRKLQARGILGDDWFRDSMAESLSIGPKPEYVNFQISVTDDKAEQRQMQQRLLPLYLRRRLR